MYRVAWNEFILNRKSKYYERQLWDYWNDVRVYRDMGLRYKRSNLTIVYIIRT